MPLSEDVITNLIGKIERFPNFTDKEKAVWKERIKIIPPEYVLFLLELFENSPEDVILLNQNIKMKEKILESEDERAWQNLLKEEKKVLEKLIK